MDYLPVPFSIFAKASSLKKLLGKYKSSSKHTVKILIGESKGPVMLDLEKVGHLLLVGWSMSNKEFVLDALLQSLMTRYTSEEVRFILADGQADLSQYGDNPYLLTEVIREHNKVVSALKWTIAEVESRYKIFEKEFVRDIGSFNAQNKEKKPRIILIIKPIEYFSNFSPNEIRDLIENILSRGAKAGIHLILVTDRINKIVISASILSNVPNRIVCQMTTKKDATDAGAKDADKLKSSEMFLKLQDEKLQKIRMIDISEKDIKVIREYFKKHVPKYTSQEEKKIYASSTTLEDEADPILPQVIELIRSLEYIGASLIQRKFRIGYARAAKILDQLEALEYLSPAEGSKPREVLKK